MGLQELHEKLDWARHHFNLLDKVVLEYIDPKNIRFAPKRYNDAKTETWGHFESTVGPTTLISHVFGDVLQSANSTLDYLVCELFRRYNPGKEAKPCHQFPIVNTHGAFNDEIGNDALYGIPFEAVAVIEGLQPYEGRTDLVNFHLKSLRSLTNEHKHRKIHVSLLAANPAPGDDAIFEKDGEFYALAKDLPKAVHPKAEIGPFPITENGEMDMNRKFTPVVVLEESEFRGEIVSLWAERFLQAVAESCNRLRPFFF
jgi:hypothetical protein